MFGIIADKVERSDEIDWVVHNSLPEALSAEGELKYQIQKYSYSKRKHKRKLIGSIANQ